jgi:hypothetical protein
MKKIIISIIIILLVILFIFLLTPKKIEFESREGWLESVPENVPLTELVSTLKGKNKDSLLWEDIVEFDDSVAGIKHRLDVEKIDGSWKVIWYGRQYKCARQGLGEWQDVLCP